MPMPSHVFGSTTPSTQFRGTLNFLQSSEHERPQVLGHVVHVCTYEQRRRTRVGGPQLHVLSWSDISRILLKILKYLADGVAMVGGAGVGGLFRESEVPEMVLNSSLLLS